MQPTTLLLCLILAGCAGAGATADLTGSIAPASAHGQSPLARSAQASAKKEEWWKEGGVTRTKINTMCWMKYENGRKDQPIDKRADLVNACVAETLKEYPVQ